MLIIGWIPNDKIPLENEVDQLNKLKIVLIICLSLFVTGVTGAALFYLGILHINNPGKRYPVRGVDVSSYQGDIDWEILSSQGIDFAYIKATEGSSYVDGNFTANWENASRYDIRIGAYHFFSFESEGRTQAESFCNTVTPVDNMLPPVIDVEFYGGFGSADSINVEDVVNELRTMVDILTEHYGMKPVIYVSRDTYNSIVKDNFDDCDIWFRSVYGGINVDIDWTFWQYSNRHRLSGFNGEETYIDMNVYNGTYDEFLSYPDNGGS